MPTEIHVTLLERRTFSLGGEAQRAHRRDGRPRAGPLRHQGRAPARRRPLGRGGGLRLDLGAADPRRVRRPHRGHARRRSRPRRIEIGTAVVPVQPRHPIALAQQALSAQAVLRGRLALGLGVSHHWIIDEMLGLPYERPARHDAGPPRRARPGPRRARARSTSRTSSFRVHNPLDITDIAPDAGADRRARPVMLQLAGERTDGTILWMADERAIASHVVPAPHRGGRGRRAARAPHRRRHPGLPVRRRRGRRRRRPHQPRPVRGRGVAELPEAARPRRRHAPSATSSPPAASRPSRSGCAPSPTPASPTCPSGSCPIGEDRDAAPRLAATAPATTSRRSPARSDHRRPRPDGDPMSAPTLDIPVFDADNHLYETRDSLTKFLPDRYKGAVDYVDVRGRTKIVVRGTISEYIPNPTFDVVARPGRPGGLLPQRQPRGQEPPRDLRRADAGDPGVPRAGAPHRADGRAGHRPGADVPDAGQPHRGADAGRPRHVPRRRSTRSTSGSTRRGPFDYEDRIFATPVITLPLVDKAIEELEWVRRARRQGRAHPARAGLGLPRARARSACRSSTRSGRRSSSTTSSSPCTRPTAATSATPNEWMGSDSEMLPFQPQAFRMLSAVAAGRGRRVGAHLPRRAVPLPAAEGRGDRERQQLGRAAAARTWPTPTRRCRRTSPRTRSTVVQAQHLRQPVLGGGPRRARRAHRRRARAVRLRLPAPRGPGRPGQLRRRARRARPRRPSARSWAATSPASWTSRTRSSVSAMADSIPALLDGDRRAASATGSPSSTATSALT